MWGPWALVRPCLLLFVLVSIEAHFFSSLCVCHLISRRRRLQLLPPDFSASTPAIAATSFLGVDACDVYHLF